MSEKEQKIVEALETMATMIADSIALIKGVQADEVKADEPKPEAPAEEETLDKTSDVPEEGGDPETETEDTPADDGCVSEAPKEEVAPETVAQGQEA